MTAPLRQETAKALAAHPDVDGIWAQAGEYGAIQALKDKGTRLVPMTGENSNGFRLALANPEDQKDGLKGVSAGSPPATAAYAFKLMMEVLTKKRQLEPMNIQYPLPWVPAADVKLCKGQTFEDGCNTFPATVVPNSFVTEVFNPTLLPELTLQSALEGKPTPGATIQPLPADVVKAADEPGHQLPELQGIARRVQADQGRSQSSALRRGRGRRWSPPVVLARQGSSTMVRYLKRGQDAGTVAGNGCQDPSDGRRHPGGRGSKG